MTHPTQIRIVLLIGHANFPHGRPIRSTTQMSTVTCDQYGISVLISQTSFGRETIGSIAKCRLFSQTTKMHLLMLRKSPSSTQPFEFVSWIPSKVAVIETFNGVLTYIHYNIYLFGICLLKMIKLQPFSPVLQTKRSPLH